MTLVFYVAAAVAVLATLRVITGTNAFHSLLYLIVSLLAVSLVFFVIGAPFVAALEVIVYAGAIIVLFLFVIMMLNLGPQAVEQERSWQSGWMWAGPLVLLGVLLGELGYVLWTAPMPGGPAGMVMPKAVGMALYGPYVLAVEFVSVLLLAGLVGAYYLGHRHAPEHGEARK